tara:strand:- start:1342 stop:2208 length:867 start_codon:yes stop_codon:yes gene_type:complete
MSMGGGGGGSGTQVTRSEPSELQKPFLQDVYSQAQQQFQRGPMQSFPGTYTAAPSDAQLLGEDMLKAASAGQAAAVTGSLFPSFQNALMSPAQAFSDPILQSSLSATLRPLERGASRLLTQAKRDANAAGQLGGTRRGILEGQVIGDYLQQASDAMSKLYSNVYGDITKSRAVTLGLTPEILSAFTTPAQTQLAAGGLDQARRQAALDEQRQKFEFAQQAPAAALNQYANIVAGSILPGRTTVSGIGGRGSALSRGIGGALAGSSLGPALGLTGPQGTLAGAALGLLV